MNIKKYSEFITENLSFKSKKEEDYIDIYAYLDNNYIGEITIEYVIGGYWMFEDEMTEDEYDEIFTDDKFARIETLRIEPKYRNMGYGKKLLNKAIDHIKKTDFKIIYLNASPMGFGGLNIDELVNLYKTIGFRIIVDTYKENKEMIFKFDESYNGAIGSTERTIDAYIKMHMDEVKKRREEKRHTNNNIEDEIENKDLIIIDEFDEDTPQPNTPMKISEIPYRKQVSLAGKTNMN